MPISKTCYFCEKENCKNCKPFCSTFGYAYVICDNCNGFTPNADWLEYIKLLDDQIAFREKAVNDLYERDCKIEALKKENEELKSLIKLMKCTRITS